MRGYGISATVICQSITQLKGMYPDDYEVIDANCPFFVFLGGDENTNNEYVYNVKSKEKYNSPENAALYFILLNIKRHIMSICNSIHFNKTTTLNKLILEKQFSFNKNFR